SGGTRRPRFIGAMRRGQNSPMDTLLKRPAREPRPPARRAYAPEGTEKKPIVFRSTGVMQRSHHCLTLPGLYI
ncbi:MAG: hypothetical protein ACQEQO_03175, partial [Thermodesulfobacteriota bacterium]